MNKEFDEIINSKFNEKIVIDYGIMKGNNRIIFIKSGQDGTIYGYQNKYLNIAHTINKKYGYTVICSSNPFDGTNPLDNAMNIIEKYCNKNNYKDYEIYYMGHSNGAIIGAQFGYKYPKIKKMLLINAPLMINYHKTKEGLLRFNQDKITMIYGDLDPSYKYVELLNNIKNKKINYLVIKGQDHHFSKNNYEFSQLPIKYLINN